ncbi:RidA family protein [Streptomyces olivaceoviridis]|uniref:RidA family protein n=1 Tax=Streptomyces olivaceoviridis TaxID=1921 RepID=UPI0036935625
MADRLRHLSGSGRYAFRNVRLRCSLGTKLRLQPSGQLSHDEDGSFLGSGDFWFQTITTLADLGRVLERFRASRTQTVETTVLARDLREHFDVVAELHREYSGERRPTSTVMGVADLALPDQLVEIGPVVRLDLPQ